MSAMVVAVLALAWCFWLGLEIQKRDAKIERLWLAVDELHYKLKRLDPAYAEEFSILDDVDPNGGIDGYAHIKLRERKKAAGEPLVNDPLLPPERR